MAFTVDTLASGRTFYHGTMLPTVRVGAPFWMTTSVETALAFGHPWRVRIARPVRVARFDGRNGYVELAELVGVVADDDDLHPASEAFCGAFARKMGVQGWHMPSFYGPRASDSMICDAAPFVRVVSRLTDAEIDRALIGRSSF